jgi:hypothetical protein
LLPRLLEVCDRVHHAITLLHHRVCHQLHTLRIHLLALLPQQLQVLALALPVRLLLLLLLVRVLVLLVIVLLQSTRTSPIVTCCCCRCRQRSSLRCIQSLHACTCCSCSYGNNTTRPCAQGPPCSC